MCSSPELSRESPSGDLVLTPDALGGKKDAEVRGQARLQVRGIAAQGAPVAARDAVPERHVDVGLVVLDERLERAAHGKGGSIGGVYQLDPAVLAANPGL